jgi:hypothetical protein
MDLTVTDSCTEHRHSEKNTRYSIALSVIGTNTQNKKTLDTIVSILYRVFSGGTQYKNTRYNNLKIINISKCVFITQNSHNQHIYHRTVTKHSHKHYIEFT